MVSARPALGIAASRTETARSRRQRWSERGRVVREDGVIWTPQSAWQASDTIRTVPPDGGLWIIAEAGRKSGVGLGGLVIRFAGRWPAPCSPAFRSFRSRR